MADNQQQYWLFEVFGTDPDEIGFFGDAGIIIPSGSTAARPTPPVEGHLRLNTDTNVFEGFFDGLWQNIGTGGGGGGTFIGLSDTPGVYAGQGNRVLKVGSAETGVEFTPNLEIEPGGRLRVPGGYEALVDADTVITNKKYVDNQDNLQLSLSGGLMGGIISMGGNAIVGLPLSPTAANEAASKSYVDSLSAGLDPKESVRAATTTDLDSVGNGVWTEAGSGSTHELTAGAVGTTTLDTILLSDGDRVLVKNEGAGVNLTNVDHGLYVVKAGTDGAGVATVLERASDQDGTPSNEVSGGNFTFIEQGTQEGTGWVVLFDGELTVDTDPMVWSQFSGSGGAFLPLAGGVMTGDIIMSIAGVQISGAAADGVSTPTYSWTTDLTTGMYRVGAGVIGFTTGGTGRWTINASGHLVPIGNTTYDIGLGGTKVRDVYADHFKPNFGAAGDPSYSFEGDTTTGMYNDSEGGVRFAVGSANALHIESDGTISVDTASYETLVLADNDIPNKKYVDDEISALTLIDDTDGDTKVDVEEGGDDDTIRMDVGDTPAGYGAVANVFLLNAAGFTIDMGTATGSGVVGAPISFSAGDGGIEGGIGGAIGITAGDGTTTGAGGAVSITTGAGGSTGASGALSLDTGATTAGVGGAIAITVGASTGTNVGGAVDITGGAASGDLVGGAVNITGGAGSGSNTGGAINLVPGAAGAASGGGAITAYTTDATDGNGGLFIVSTGDGAGAFGQGGTINLDTGNGAGAGAGGPIRLRPGFGGPTDGVGGKIAGYGGEGFNGGDGGDILWKAGTGGSTDGTSGGSVRLSGGSAGGGAGTDFNGGSVLLQGAGGVAEGIDGAVVIETLSGGDAIDTPTDLRFLESVANGTNYVGFKAPISIAGNVIWTLPIADSTGTQSLVSDGAGVLSWSDLGGSGITDEDGDTTINVEESADEDIIRFDTGDSPAGYGDVTDIMILASSNWTVAMGTASGSTTPGAPISLSAGIGGTEAGGDGGDITLNAGDAGTGSTGAGGDVFLNTGSGDGAGVAGSVIMQSGGATFMTFAAGSGTITTPDGTNRDFSITAGDATTSTNPGGILSFTAGDGGTEAGGDGGTVVVNAGDAGAGSAGDGGDIELRPGALDGGGADGVVRVIGASAGAGELRLEDDAGGEYIGLQAASTILASFTLTLPSEDAEGSQALFSDGAGTLNFQTVSTSALADADGDTKVDVEESGDEDIIRFSTGETPAGFGSVPNIMTLASSGWTVAMGTANVAATTGAPISITSGTGNTSGGGGDISFTAGDAGTSGFAFGGSFTFDAGAGGGGSSGGGGFIVNTGDATGGGTAGFVTITTGTAAGAGASGDIDLVTGTGGAVGGNAGGITIKTGDGGGVGGGSGGPINLRGGAGTVAASGGAITGFAGVGAGIAGGGLISFIAGKGGATANGGAASLTAGAGGATSGAGGTATLRGGDADGGGAGGDADVIAGAGASAGGVVNITAGNSTGADDGGAVNISAGNSGGGGSAAGGSINIDAGSPSTSGDGGSIALNPTAGTGSGSDGQVVLGIDGSDANPAFRFASGNTGFFSGGAGFSFNSAIAIDRSGVTPTLVITAAGSNGTIGVGSGALQLVGGSTSFFATRPTITLSNVTDGGAIVVGKDLTIDAGDESTTGVGGDLSLSAGAAATSGDGGAVNIDGGAASGSGDGGSVTLTPGAGAGVGSAGNVILDLHTWPSADGSANQVLSTDGSGILSFISGGAVAGSRFTLAFDDGDLTAGVLTVTHSLGLKFNHVTIYNNSDMVIIPTGITAVNTSSLTVDLSGAQVAEGGAIPGTWNVVVSP